MRVVPVMGLPEVRPGDDLAGLLAAHAQLRDGDVLVVAQKIVSKAEGAIVDPPPAADPHAARRLLAEQQAVRVVARAPHALIVETVHGLVCANAGIDASNVPGGRLTLLPVDPDASARALRDRLRAATGAGVAVIVSDTFGRPWRLGQTDVAIGVAGLAALRDDRGSTDREGNVLEATLIAVADELAGAADLVRGKASGVPAAVVRGFDYRADEEGGADALVRPSADDLFPRGRGGVADALAVPLETLPAGAPVAPHDLDRALRAVARRDVVAEPRAATAAPTAVTVSADDPLAAGLAAGVLVAALVDLGYAAVAQRHPPAAMLVLAARPPRPAR